MPYRTTDPVLLPDLSIFPPTSKTVLFALDNPDAVKPHDVDTLVGIAVEPNAISNTRDFFIKNRRNFDVIFTHDEEILKACENAKVCVYGTTWIAQSVYENIDTSRKQPKISCLTGSKEVTPAHSYRKFLYANQLKIPFPITWFRSGEGELLPAYQHNPVLTAGSGGKNDLFLDFQFSIAIENSSQRYYFTEKLIDCLITKTIPIYYGCRNISEYFDTRGWIILETTDIREFIHKVSSALPKYEDCIEVIEHNYREALKYKDFQGNLQRAMNLGL
jgi:hypothetical protein